MEKDTGNQGLMTSNRKVADYLLRALQQSQSQNASAVRHFVYLAEDELEKPSGKKSAAG